MDGLSYSLADYLVDSGRVIKELGYRRSDLIITTKVYWGVRYGSPNDTGLSRKQWVWHWGFSKSNTYLFIIKSIIEGTKECLERLQMDYVDVIFAHRPDNTGIVNMFDRILLVLIIFAYSAHGRSSSRIQLRDRTRMGASFLFFYFPSGWLCDRRSIGQRRNGVLARLRRLIVCFLNLISERCLIDALFLSRCSEQIGSNWTRSRTMRTQVSKIWYE